MRTNGMRLCALLAVVICTSAHAKLVDRVVAVVNDEVVTLSELQEMAAPQMAQEQGITDLVEIGAGKVLTGMVRRIDRELSGTAVNGPADIEAFLGTL